MGSVRLYAAPTIRAGSGPCLGPATRAKAFQEAYKGRLATLDGAALGRAIADYEAIVERIYKAMSYAHLLFSGDVSDAKRGRFFQTIRERITTISTDTLFFELELNRVDDATLAGQLEDPAAKRYAPWVRDVRVMRPHQLSDEVEKLLHEKAVAGKAAWVRLFDETQPVFASRLTAAISACPRHST